MTDDDLQLWAASRRRPRPSPAEADALVERWARRSRIGRLRLGGLGLALAAAVAVVVALQGRPERAESTPPRVVAHEPEVRTLEPGVHVEDGDRIEVDAGGAVAVAAPGRLVLTSGTVRVQARPRPASAPLTVSAGPATVTVVGTRFVVTREPLRVAVSEGIVRVTLDGADHRVEAGETWPPPPPPPALDLDAVRAAMLTDPAGARATLRDHVARSPRDADAWDLLGRLEAREGRVGPAERALAQVLAFGRPAQVRRARYELARLLEDRPREAIPWLRAYLDDPGPWEAEARLRLGRALRSVGDPLADETLRRVTTDHPGTAAAAEARALLGDPR